MYVKKDITGMKNKEVMTFAQTYLYEPAIEYGKMNDSYEYKCIFDKPSSLPKYLCHFCPPDDSISCDECPLLSQCIGVDEMNPVHAFLSIDGVYKCASCGKCFYRTCGYDTVKGIDLKKKLKYYYKDKNNF